MALTSEVYLTVDAHHQVHRGRLGSRQQDAWSHVTGPTSGCWPTGRLLALGASVARHAGSNPVIPTIMKARNKIDDDGKLKQRYYNKQANAEKEGIDFDLTLDQFRRLLVKANIVSSMCGIKGYHLARNNDSGAYAYGNCAFVWYLDNLHARKATAKSRAASRRNLLNALASAKMLTDAERKERSTRISRGIRNSESYKTRVVNANAKLVHKKRTEHKSYAGTRNSQFGTYWITNGCKSIKWSDSNGKIPRGYLRGRKLN